MTQEGTAKIRMKNQKLDGPTKLRVTPRYDAIFDENGVAEVPRAVASLLLGHGYPGIYELVTETEKLPEKMPEEKLPESARIQTPKVVKQFLKQSKKEVAPSKEEMDETKAFAQSIVE
jgi:hypothetical protein